MPIVNMQKLRKAKKNAKVLMPLVFKEKTSCFPSKLPIMQHCLLSFKCIKQVKGNLATHILP